jgi:hypothetical protein
MSGNVFSQTNFFGKPGLVRIPKPSFNEDRDNVLFNFSYMPREYSVNNFMNRRSEELFYSLNLRPINWLSVNLVITRPINVPRIGIGDRHLDFQFYVLNQKRYGINLSMIFSPATTSSFIDHNSVFISREIKLSKTLSFEPVFGYGLKVNYRKPTKLMRYEDDGYQWIKKSEFGNYYLSGFFGGININVKDKLFLSAEYDTQYINLSSSVTLFKKLNLKAMYLDFTQLTGQVSYTIFLDKSLKRNVKFHE